MTIKATKTVYQSEMIRPMCDHKTAITRLTGDIGGKYGLFIEAIWNSHEHGGANHIWITISGRGATYEVIVVDDGKGMNSQRRQRSLNAAMTAEVQTGRNFQDLGGKRFAADFKHATVYTISAEEKAADPDNCPMWVLDYDFDRLFDILAVNAKETIESKPLTPDFKAMELPEGSTGVKIHLSQSREGRPHFTAEKLRRELTDHLPPQIAAKVYINGLPLEQRQIVGEPFTMVIDDHPKLGRIELDLYIPKVRSSRDELKVGPFEGICGWRAFCQNIPEEILGDRLNILSEGVYGEIHVEGFKGFVAASRQAFEVRLFSSTIISTFVDLMENEVCGKLEELMGVIKQNQVSERDQRLLDELSKYTGALGGDDERHRGETSVLTLDTSFIEVLPSQKVAIEIRVDKYNPKLAISWDASACGGKAEISRDGRSVKYWPGTKVGAYDLVCFYDKEPKTRAKVDISIVSQKLLRIHPRRVTVHPGRTQSFTALNWEDNSSGEGKLFWKLDEDDKEGRFVVTTRKGKQDQEIGFGSQVTYRAGDQLGTYRIHLCDSGNLEYRKALKAGKFKSLTTADVTVAEPIQRQKGGGSSNQNDVVIEGARYQLGFEYMEQYPGMSRLYSGSGKKQIRINRCHLGCKHAEKRRGDDGLLELALSQLLLQHIDEQSRVRGEDLTGEEKTRRFADLYVAMVTGYEKHER